MWTKVKPNQGRHSIGRESRTSFAVQRSPSSSTASLLIPARAYAEQTRCSVYANGNKLAFLLGGRGEYAVTRTGPGSKARKVTIPAIFAALIPYGTTDISHEMDGDMIVIDLSRFAVRVAAE